MDVSEERFRALLRRILDLLAFYGAQHEWWRDKRTGICGVTTYLDPAAQPALEKAWGEVCGNTLAT